MVFGRIYSIRSHQTDDIYIGSTKQTLCRRMSEHRSSYRGQFGNYTSYKILQFEDAYIELIEENEFESRDALLKREGELIRTMNCVNKCINGTTLKERYNIYYQKNKEKRLLNQKQYYQDNKEKRKQHQKDYQNNNPEKRKEQQKKYYQKKKSIENII